MIRVLVVDDHPVLRDGLGSVLQRETGISVVGTAGSGSDAVALAVEHVPDVVVMDIAMPGLNGLDATARIRRELPGTQVVILSMHATSEHLHQALAAGAVGFVVKTSAGAEVVSAVRDAAVGKRYLSASLARTALDAGYAAGGQRPIRVGPLESLSPREREVMQLVVDGRSSREIAVLLGLRPGTVDTYRSRVMRKLGLDDVMALVRFAVEHGLTPG